jgi:hypothetical protein
LIAKQVALRSARKGDFADLVRYITDAQGKVQRVGHVVVTNCTSDNPLDAAIEVRLTQQANTRSAADKTYHLIVSFRMGEHPSAEVLQAIEQRLCEGLGFGDHQRVSASHHDTDNLHVHIAINKVHPTRHTVHAPYYDHTTLGKLCEELETTYGLQTDNHAAQQRGAQSRAVEMEHHTGVESLVGWVQRECLDRIQGVSSWAELHDTLLEHGLELKTRANGFVLTDREGHHAKASSVDRSLSKPRLEKRLGPFEPFVYSPEDPPITARSRYEKKPLPFKVDTTALYVRFQHEKEHSAQARAAEMTMLRQRQSVELEQLRRTGGFQHAAIKLLGGDRLTKKALYAMAARARKTDLAQLCEQHRRERHFLRQQFTRKGWTDWLRAQALSGDPEALRTLQAQRTEHGRPEDTASVVTHHVGRAAIRDEGRRLHVAHGADQSTVDAALRIAVERYGQRLHVAGSDEFKTRVVAAAVRAAFPVTFADAALEQRRPTFSPTASQEPTRDHPERRRVDAGGAGVTQPGAAYDRRAKYLQRGARGGRSDVSARAVGGDDTSSVSTSISPHDSRPAQRGKPHVGRVGSEPPPAAKNRLRNLSQLGVVQLARRSEVLLPGDVPGRLEQPDTQSDHALRRPVSGARGAGVAVADAVDKFIAERNAKRIYIHDIPKYERYTSVVGTLGRYAGTRSVDGQWLALLQRDEVVDVLPIDAATAVRLKRFRIGDAVAVQRQMPSQTNGRTTGPAIPTYLFKPSASQTMTLKKARSR